MEKQGLWKLFFATGLPEVYLAIGAAQEPRRETVELSAKTAFRPEGEGMRPV